MTRALTVIFALSAAPAAAQVLDPPPSLECQWVYEGGEATGAWSRRWVCPRQAWDITWRADLYAKDFVMRDVPLDAIAGRMDQPPFPTRRDCEANGYREATRMVDFITAYMEADGSVRWECRAILAE